MVENQYGKDPPRVPTATTIMTPRSGANSPGCTGTAFIAIPTAS